VVSSGSATGGTAPGNDITRLLANSREGDRAAFDQLLPLVYAELRKIAAGYMSRQDPGHTLQPTALLHEAYLKMAGAGGEYRDRSHFFTVAAAIMRNILVDHVRTRMAEKRGGDLMPVQLAEAYHAAVVRPNDLIALDDALDALAKTDERKARVLELRYFGGLSVEETATALGVSVATIGRETRFAEVWLRRELQAAGQ